MDLTTILLILCTILIAIMLIVLLVSFIKRPKGFENLSSVIEETKKQNEFLEKTIKNLFETENKSNEKFNELLLTSISKYNESVANYLSNLSKNQTQQLDNIEKRLNEILQANDNRLNRISDILTTNMKTLQENNDKKLEQMRQTVDEKLSSTLEKRLSESVNVIVKGLDVVSKSVGEMQSLANGVGDLKRVLTNVKTRGGWGEVQLSTLLEQILSPTQYQQQVRIKQNSNERVDFVVVLPGKENETLYLPIDAKFPLEDYSRLCAASEQNDIKEVENQTKNLENRIKEEAKNISEKYISVPTTTDFAVMYLPVEGLYAEVIRRPALCEYLQHKYKIMVCGPTTLTALLNSLQMGFKTLAIEKRSSEIWNTLGVFKTEFNKFVDLLAKTQKKIDEASTTLDFATKRTKTIQRKLKDVADISPDENITFDETDLISFD